MSKKNNERKDLNSHSLLHFKNLMKTILNASTEYVSDLGISQQNKTKHNIVCLKNVFRSITEKLINV